MTDPHSSGPSQYSSQLPPTLHDEPFELGSGEVDLLDTPQKRRGGGSWFAWLLVLALLGGAGAFAYYIFLPQKDELARVNGALLASQALTQKLQADQAAVVAERDQLQAAKTELASTVEKQDNELSKLAHTQQELNEKLMQEIQRGDVLVREHAGQLIVDVSDKVLFESGDADLNGKGKEVLKRVGDTMLKAEHQVIEVGGHTDGQAISPKLIKRFPSNWELSAARATEVVRFLQDECKIPGERLVASGFSEYRPVANNKTAEGRKKNRRIEVILLPEVKPIPIKK